jgi:hypothetical protein
VLTEAGPLVQLQISLSRVPWRLAPAWSVLAGALAAGSRVDNPTLWLRVVAAIVLGDLAWGVLRRYVSITPSGRRPVDASSLVLPYAQPDSPLSSLVSELSLEGVDWHGAVAGVILALGGALLLGLPAFVLSLGAIVVTVVAWALARRGEAPAACFALLDVLLPFALGLLAAGCTLRQPVQFAVAWQPLLVAAGFTILQWGALRSAALVGRRFAQVGLGLGVFAVLVVLIGLGMPFAAAVSAVLLAPAVYWLTRDADLPATSGGGPGPYGAGTPAGRASSAAWAAPWLMLALFVGALAIR